MLAIPILSALLASLLIIMFACWWLKKRRNTKGKSQNMHLIHFELCNCFSCHDLIKLLHLCITSTKVIVEVDELEETKRHRELQFFDLNTLREATDNFSHVNELGQGGFGSVYKVSPNLDILNIQ